MAPYGSPQWQLLIADFANKSGSLAQFAATTSAELRGVISDETGTGALVFATSPTLVTPNLGITPQGRLTLATATPVMTTTQSAKTAIFYTPYEGNIVPLYDGTTMRATTFSELTVATTDTTKNPAAIGASKVNDWFIWDDAGTLRISHSPDWTNDTTRSAALVRVNGIWLNNAAITNGPAASRGTYVGTTRSNASSQLDWILGSSAAGGGAASLNVWNAYNRVNVGTTVVDSTSSWTQVSATIGALNASNTNRISFVAGLAEDAIDASLQTLIGLSNVANASGQIGLALDSTTVFDIRNLAEFVTATGISGAFIAPAFARYMYAPQLGFHFIQANQAGDGTNTATFLGQNREGLMVGWRA